MEDLDSIQQIPVEEDDDLGLADSPQIKKSVKLSQKSEYENSNSLHDSDK
jgi:hypothetical protein